MGYYELDGEQVVEAIVRALGEDARTVSQDYRAYGRQTDEDRRRHAVAHFVDQLMCEVQEMIGDPEVRWEGPYWEAALEALEEED